MDSLLNICELIVSDKITVRRKAVVDFNRIVKETIEYLDEEKWTLIFKSIHGFLVKEVQKNIDDTSKKRSTTEINGSLFLETVETLIQYGQNYELQEILKCIVLCLKNQEFFNYTGREYLNSLDKMLINEYIRGNIEPEYWNVLYKKLKSKFMDSQETVQLELLKTMASLLKYGPTHGMPPDTLRKDFEFIKKLTQDNYKSGIHKQNAVIQIVYNFCIHTCKDSRRSACKFGEETFDYLITFYEIKNPKIEEMKITVIKYLLLQITIHHPKSCTMNQSGSYAHSETVWNNCLSSLYEKLWEDVLFNSTQSLTHSKNLLFATDNNIVKDFSRLFVEVVYQVSKRNQFKVEDVKRVKRESSVIGIIENIDKTHHWSWIYLMGELLKKYPEILCENDYVFLLQVLSKVQIECKNSKVAHHMYSCLSLLIDMKSPEFCDNSSNENIWKLICDTTIRSFGLNQNDPELHKLLQKLIIHTDYLHLDSILKTYTSEVLDVTTDNLKTLAIIFNVMNSVQNIEQNYSLIKWIMNLNKNKIINYSYLSNSITSQILVRLVSKKWASLDETEQTDSKEAGKNDVFNEITCVYLRTMFQDDDIVESEVEIENQDLNNGVFNDESQTFLKNSFHDLLGNIFKIENKAKRMTSLVHVVAFLKNINSHCLNYGLFQNDLHDNFFMNETISILQEINECFKSYFFKENIDFHKLPDLIESISIFHNMFSNPTNAIFDLKFRETFPIELLKSMYSFLQKNLEKNKSKLNEKETLLFNVKLEIMKALVGFCCGLGELKLEVQRNLFQVLIETKYNIDEYNNSNLPLTFLKSIMKYKNLKNLQTETIDPLLSLLNLICTVRYKYYSDATEILEFLHFITPLVAISGSEDNKKRLISLLYSFYTLRDNYGPGFLVLLVKCIGKLHEVDPSSEFSIWNNSPIITVLPKFICSKYQEVRLATVSSIYTFFELSSKKNYNVDYDLQTNFFRAICNECENIFRIEGTLTKDGEVDEAVTRSATVLKVLTSILKIDNHMKLDVLFNLFKLVQKYHLRDIVQNIVIKTDFLNMCLLEKYLCDLLLRWVNENLDLDNFPFTLYGCETRIGLYKKYFVKLVPFLVEFDSVNLKEVCEERNESMEKIVEESFAVLFVSCLVNNVSQLNEESLQDDKFMKIILQHFKSDQFKSLFIENVDRILENLISKIRDEENFYEQFQLEARFGVSYSKSLTVAEFQQAINSTQEIISLDEPLISLLCKKYPYKIMRILMELNLNIHNSIVMENKLISFHQYAVFNNFITENLDLIKSNNFFIRDNCFGLLRFIKHHENHKLLAQVACIYLRNCVKNLLEYSEEFRKHFKSIVSILINIVVENEKELLLPSIEILNILVIENGETFSKELKSMEDFPNNANLSAIIDVQLALKNDAFETDLQTNISNFVNLENISGGAYCSKLDSLKSLKNSLSSEKAQLQNLYMRLAELNGFSEECENSLIHKLICRLIELSQCGNKELSIEALKCLGELGPSNLYTLVVKPEKYLTYKNSTPSEFLTGRIISILDSYLTDFNIQLYPHSLDVLFDVLNIKEGRNVIDSDDDFGFGLIDKEYLIPFLNDKKPKALSLQIEMNTLITRLNSDELWCNRIFSEYDEWLRTLLITILETTKNSFLRLLIPLCKMKVEFCEALLPPLIYLLISNENAKINAIITEKINKFFDEHWNRTTWKHLMKDELIVTNKKALQVMIDMVHFIRVSNKSMRTERNLENLNLDFLKIAKAAQYCNAYFTSLLYVELWCYSEFEAIDTKDASFKDSILDFILKEKPNDISQAVDNILRYCYKSIGDTDALKGCSSRLILDRQLRIKHYEDFGMWDQAMFFHDVQVSRGIPNTDRMLRESFKHCELYESSLLHKENSDFLDYECLWRLGKWEQNDTIPKKNKLNTVGISFEDEMEKYKYFALKNIHENDSFGVIENIEKARLTVIEKLRKTNLESSQNLYNILSFLRSFNEIEDFLNADTEIKLETIMEKWDQQDVIKPNNFSYIEPVMRQRMVLLNEFVKNFRTNSELCKKYLIDFSLKLSEKARLENKSRIGMRSIMFVENLSELTENERGKIYLEDAQLCLKMNNSPQGIAILTHLISNENLNEKLRSVALKLNGEWSAESRSEPARTIIEKYFLKSLDLCRNTTKTKLDRKAVTDTYITLAKFADTEYQQIASHMASDIFQKKVRNLEISTSSLSKRRTSLAAEEKKARTFLEKQIAIDEVEIEHAKDEKDFFLLMSLKYYMQSLIHSNDNNLQIFRLMTLFRENRNHSLIQDSINEDIPKIPSSKFLIILPQLIPHIGNNGDFFRKKCTEIINRCAKEHPFHTLPLILSLANSNKDCLYNNSKTTTSNEERQTEARKMIQFFKTDKNFKNIIEKFELLSEALIELAYLKQERVKHTASVEIPKKCKIRKIKEFSMIPVLTDTLKVNKNCNYDDIIGIYEYKNNYNLVGGLNVPKRIVCIGMDGKPREQLVKGQDDLRQDAVMQQVFTILNNLLSLNRETHGLKIRTYKIVPLSMRSGILEWAKNTIPLGMYLIGNDKDIGAHRKYRPQDKDPASCRKELTNCSKSSAELKLAKFNEICKLIKPVFHKFFEEHFLHPTVWYERRRAYIQSVATTSMCGYILGLGDRHVSNILIDKTTAEIVHIDFGIAFEQGRTLLTPETVPFRLTRDIVDGMGVGGVEGTFRRSCEKTLLVLRENHQTIMAILEVLLYDPLYMWTVNAEEAQRRQRDLCSSDATFKCSSNDEDTSINKTAERALLRLRAKLHGTEDGIPTSVENQVRILIHQAMDPSNLSKLFHGWQAYL